MQGAKQSVASLHDSVALYIERKACKHRYMCYYANTCVLTCEIAKLREIAQDERNFVNPASQTRNEVI